MLRYKVVRENKPVVSNNLAGICKALRQDYRQFFNLSPTYIRRYDVLIEAIYSCLSVVNSMENKNVAREILIDFLVGVKRVTGIDMQIINNGSFYVRRKAIHGFKH